MVEDIAWPSLFLAQKDKAQREQAHYRHIFQRNSVSGIKPESDEVSTTKTLITQSEVQKKNTDTSAPLTAPSTKIISGFKNTTNPIATVAATVITTNTVFVLPTIRFRVNDDTSGSYLILGPDAVGSRKSAAEFSVPIPAPLISSQNENITTPTPVYSIPSDSPYNELHINKILISSSSSLSIHLNSSSTETSTLTKNNFTSFVTITSGFSSYGVRSQKYPTATSRLLISTESTPSAFLNITTDGNNRNIDQFPNTANNPVDQSSRKSFHLPHSLVVIGSVMGSIAGIAIIFFLVTLFLRCQKSKWTSSLFNDDQPNVAKIAHGAPSAQTPNESGRQILQASNLQVAVPFTKNSKLSSQKLKETTSSIDTGEVGFYRISGRKLPSVLQFGGDGYGGDIQNKPPLDESPSCCGKETFRNSSMSPTKTIISFTAAQEDNNTINNFRLSQKTITEPDLINRASLQPPGRPDAVGRSLPSMDSSRASRFTEDI